MVYLSKEPQLVVSWIHCFLFEQLKENNTFISDFVEEIKFTNYELTLENNKIRLRLSF